MLDDGLQTPTSTQQNALEKKILGLYQEIDNSEADDITEALRLLRSVHTTYLHSGLGKLPGGFSGLGASRPWITYWITHSLALLGADLPRGAAAGAAPSAADVVHFLRECQSPTGGFGGGPLQIPHLAPSYAAVCTLVTLGGGEALQAVDRAAMREFLHHMAIPPERGGGFSIHLGGEADLRACYLAIAIAYMLDLNHTELAAAAGAIDYIKRCQTYEGGLGGEPGNEAHGGYTFCGLAALALLGQETQLDLPRLISWAAQRQGSMEGGFNGRTNKLVDGCYSFWQGGLFAILQRTVPGALWQTNTGPECVRVSPPPAAAASTLVGDAALEAAVALPNVVPLPLDMPKSPLEQAAAVLQEKQAVAQQMIGVALQAGERADAALQAGTERTTSHMASEARQLLDRAGAAQAAAEAANLSMNYAACSAAGLFPLPDPQDPPLPATVIIGGQPLHLSPPLYNYKALQLWVLRCCQQMRGGLRDKPGKPVDYYHTCYCLSGLSSAQHASNVTLGPRENLLHRADPLCNVVEEKLEAARRYYAASPLPPRPPQHTSSPDGDGSQSNSSSEMDVDT